MPPLAELLTLPNVLAGIIILSLNAYVLLGGADYGGGIWDLFARGPRRERQRALIAHAIGPIWEANHVWLILVIVLLFTCFPRAYSTIATELHVPLTLMLVGVVLRGSAFTFRTYDSQHHDVQRRWGLVFSLSSIFTPALLGICVGAIASGGVGRAASLVRPTFVERFITPWANPFVMGVGLFALCLFAFLAAVYLTVESGDDVGLQRDFRRRALGSGVAVFLCAGGTLLLAEEHAPRMREMLMESGTALPLHLVTGVAAVAALVGVVVRRFQLARLAAGAQISLILWGWALAEYPYIIPPTLTIDAAAAPPATMRLILVALSLGVAVLVPSLVYLLRVFKSKPAAFDGLEESATD